MESNQLEELRKKYYRVTEILCPFNGYGSAPHDLMRKYQHRGTVVHEACNAFIKHGEAWWLGLTIKNEDGTRRDATDEEIKLAEPWIAGFKKWWNPDWQLLEMNLRLYNDSYKFTGEFDLLIERASGIVLVDIKTSKSINKTWQYQLSAYAEMHNNSLSKWEKIDNLIVLQLFEDSSDPKELEYDYDFDTFLECFKMYKLFFPKKKLTYDNID